MATPTTLERLSSHWREGRFLCIGLDPDLKKIPTHIHQGRTTETILAFNRAVIEATGDLVAAYKPNIAFYERFGAVGLSVLKETIATIRDLSPDAVVILDAKRADIGNSNRGYVDATFTYLGADATTVNPYLGFEALKPYAELKSHLMYVLCRTSNDGAGEFQDLDVDGEPLFLRVARNVATNWNTSGNFGLVVGATSPDELALVRREVPSLPLLIPGVGRQGGDPAVVARVIASTGTTPNVLINVSRNVLEVEATRAGLSAAMRRAASDLSGLLASGLS